MRRLAQTLAVGRWSGLQAQLSACGNKRMPAHSMATACPRSKRFVVWVVLIDRQQPVSLQTLISGKPQQYARRAFDLADSGWASCLVHSGTVSCRLDRTLLRPAESWWLFGWQVGFEPFWVFLPHTVPSPPPLITPRAIPTAVCFVQRLETALRLEALYQEGTPQLPILAFLAVQ